VVCGLGWRTRDAGPGTTGTGGGGGVGALLARAAGRVNEKIVPIGGATATRADRVSRQQERDKNMFGVRARGF
jgi:hypothetical protein